MKAAPALVLERVLRPGQGELPVPARPGTGGRLRARPRGKNFVGELLELAGEACCESSGSRPKENPKPYWDLLVSLSKDNVFGSYGQLLALSFHLNSGNFSLPLSGRAGAENSGCRESAQRVVRSGERYYSAEIRQTGLA